MDERELERLAERLGHRRAAQLDPDRTAAGVLARLRARREPAWWASPALLRLAAAVTIMVGAGVFAYRVGYAPGRATLPAPVALRTLSNNELEEVLDSLAYEAPTFEQAAGMGNLTEDQLRELLGKMEG